MPTKTELQAKISRLEGIIQDQSRALASLQDEGMEITIPQQGWEHNQIADAGPRLREPGGWRQQVMPLFFEVVRTHGVLCGGGNMLHAPAFLQVSSDCGGERFLLPKLAGLILADFIEAASQYGRACYAAGVEQGTNMLARMAKGEVTLADFEQTVKRETNPNNESRSYRAYVPRT